MNSKKTRNFIIVIAALAVLVVFYALFLHEPTIDTPPVILAPAQTDAQPGGDPSGEVGLNLAEVTPETVQSVISTLKRADSWSRTVTIEDFWDGGSRSTELSVWTSGGRTRIRYAGSGDIKNILLLDGRLYIWYDGERGVFESDYQETDLAEADAWLRCLTYEELLELPAGEITGAGYAEYADVPCIYAEWHTRNFGYVNRVYVSVSTGLLMGSETYDGEDLIYRMSSSAPNISDPDENWFSPPDAVGGS